MQKIQKYNMNIYIKNKNKKYRPLDLRLTSKSFVRFQNALSIFQPNCIL